MNNIVAYTRASTHKQKLTNLYQLDEIEKWSKSKGYNIVGCFHDTSTGQNMNRLGLLKSIDLAVNLRAHIVTHTADRLTRSVEDMAEISRLVQGRVVFISGGNVREFHENEVREVSRRTSSVMQYMKAQGKYTGGKPPFGFSLVSGELVKNEAEQAVIAEARKMRRSGLSYRAISEEMEAKGFTGRTGKPLGQTQLKRLAL